MFVRKSSLIVFCLITSFILAGFPLTTSHADTFRPVVRGKRGVVAGGQPLSVEAGLRILQRGGNAVDAGVATILAASVIEFSHFSFGGEVPILIKLKGQKVVVIEGMGQAPMKATREFFVNRASSDATPGSTMPAAKKTGLIPSTGPLSATVPAVLDACVTALDQFGTKTLAEVMEPAIQLADGFPIDELRVQYIKTRAPIFAQWEAAKRVFLPGGEVPKVGDIFVQADLARTLREIVRAERLASRGTRNNRHAGLMAARDYFYRGPIARRIGDYMQANGGLIAADDFAKFAAKVGQPVVTEYRGYQVFKAGFWTQGPAMIETLNMLEGFDESRTLRPEAGFVHLVTAIASLDWLAHLRRELCKVVRGQQTAVCLHVVADTTCDWTTIEIVARCHQTCVTIVSRTLRREAFGLDDRAQGARQVCLNENVAGFRHLAVWQEDPFCIGPLRKDR